MSDHLPHDDPAAAEGSAPGAAPDVPSTGETAPRRGPRRHLAWAALGVAALGVAGGAVAATASGGAGTDRVAVAAAADGGTATDDAAADDSTAPEDGAHRRPGAHGTVSGLDGTSFTVTDDSGEATSVTTDVETRVLDVAAGEVADVAVGDHVVAGGEVADDGSVTARHVTDLGALDPADLPGPGGHRPPMADDDGDPATPPEGAPTPPEDAPAPPEGADGERPHGRPVAGEVTAVDGAAITVATADGTSVVVTTTADTEVTVVTEITVADLADGDTVGVRGEAAEDGTVTADVIIRGEPGEGRPGFGLGGPGHRGGPGHHGGPGAAEDGAADDGTADDGSTTTTEG